MYMNLSDVLTSEGKVVKSTVPVEKTRFQCSQGDFEIVEKSPAEITLSNIREGRALVEGSFTVVLKMECDRCLKEVLVKLELPFSREVFSPELQDADWKEENQGLMEGYQMNMETLFDNEILINLPQKVLCQPECRGICKKCGHDLNEGECGCDTFVPDPRMAAIKDIFNGKREV